MDVNTVVGAALSTRDCGFLTSQAAWISRIFAPPKSMQRRV